MIGIKYGKFNETADLKGMSVAEVREQYAGEFGLTNKTRAKLNGEKVGRKQEQERILVDEDELRFVEKSNKKLVLVGAFLMTLVLTGGIFAYTATALSTSFSVSPATSDFASVTVNNSVTYPTLLGNHTGAIPPGNLFDIAGDSNYTGDVDVIVTVTNPEELVEDYRFWTMRLMYVNNSDNLSADVEQATKILSISNPTASFTVDSANLSGNTFYVMTPGGAYRTLPIAAGSVGNNPTLFLEIVQTGAQ